MTGDSFTFKDVVEFGCKEGYLLTGSAVRECLNTGDWDGVTPECKRTCPLPFSSPEPLVLLKLQGLVHKGTSGSQSNHVSIKPLVLRKPGPDG